MKADIRKLLPSHSLFTRKNLLQVQTPTPEHKKEMFELATHPEGFYYLITMLNVSHEVALGVGQPYLPPYADLLPL